MNVTDLLCDHDNHNDDIDECSEEISSLQDDSNLETDDHHSNR